MLSMSNSMRNPADLLDAQPWETAAFAWLFDARTPEARHLAWSRIQTAYPNATTEGVDDFWARFTQTAWYKTNRRHYRHQVRSYSDSWFDEYETPEGGEFEEYHA